MDFRVVASQEAEDSDRDLPAGARVLAHARGKAREVAARAGIPAGGAVLGADTEVVLDGRTLGKPRDAGEARTVLGALGGRAHEVLTGMVLVTPGGEREHLERAVVRFRPLPPALLDWYLATGEWRERAGGYAVQGAGAALVERVEGEPGTVIGLPVAALGRLLEGAGLAPWAGSG
ncbi:MAG: Maf family protein [Thermoleophilia bacterium]|nr:Maf family protein [Thermoleophilia bacterium]